MCTSHQPDPPFLPGAGGVRRVDGAAAGAALLPQAHLPHPGKTAWLCARCRCCLLGVEEEGAGEALARRKERALGVRAVWFLAHSTRAVPGRARGVLQEHTFTTVEGPRIPLPFKLPAAAGSN